MKTYRRFIVICAAAVFCAAALILVAGVSAGEAVKSGPQVGEDISGRFAVHGLNTALGGRNYCPV